MEIFIDDEITNVDEEMKAFTSINSNCNIESLITKIRRKHYDLTPDWQREFVWNTKQKSALIESVLIGLPIPSIFIFQNPTYPHDVIDGKQRLTTLFTFTNDGFHLSGLTTLRSLNGKKYSELPDGFKEKLESYDININMISSSDPNLKFKMFERLNTGGTSLNDQEVRNCVFRGPFNDLLRKLAMNDVFVELMGRNFENKRMVNEATILSYFVFHDLITNNSVSSKKSFKGAINQFCEKNQNADVFTLNQLSEDFKFTCRAASKIFGDGTAFRKLKINPDGTIADNTGLATNNAIFRLQLMAFSLYRNRLVDLQLRSDEIRACFFELLSDENFRHLILYSGGNFRKNYEAFIIWSDVLAEIMQTPAKVSLNVGTTRVGITPEIRKMLWDNSRDKNCHICGNKILSINDMQVDHIIPVSRGGTNAPNNLAISHSVCNNTKNNYLIIHEND